MTSESERDLSITLTVPFQTFIENRFRLLKIPVDVGYISSKKIKYSGKDKKINLVLSSISQCFKIYIICLMT